MNTYDIELGNITKRYGKLVALNNVNLEIRRGEFFTLLGPSGSGKTTTLRIIMGFEHPTSGDIIVRNEIVTNQPSYKRNIGMVFQNYALFPHLTVFENIAFPLKLRKKRAEYIIKRQVSSMLELVGLQGYEDRYPKQLSGGEQQRVALSRALVFEPTILLLDEPLGALDRKLRDKMRMEIKRIQKRLQTTTIYVTHDQEEALALSDRIAVIRHGVIEQVGTPEELYKHPKKLFIASFIGESNMLAGTILQIGHDYAVVVMDSGAKFKIPMNDGLIPRQRVKISIRPENINLSTDKDNRFSGQVMESSFMGTTRRITVNVNGTPLKICIPAHTNCNIGDVVSLSFASEDCVIFKEG